MNKRSLFLASLLVGGCATARAVPETPASAPRVLTLDSIVWAADWRAPVIVKEGEPDPSLLLGHYVEWAGFSALEEFTGNADSLFVLEHEGVPLARAVAGTGGVTSSDGRTRYVTLHVQSGAPLDPTVEYALRPRNQERDWQWTVTSPVHPLERLTTSGGKFSSAPREQ